MAAIATIIKKRVILRVFAKLVGLGMLYLIPTLCLDYSNTNKDDVKTNLNIQICFLRFCVGIGFTVLTTSEKQEL